MRISPKNRRLAFARPYLPWLLRANRTVAQAEQELRWIRKELPPNEWLSAVQRRHQLEPLQYILGSQPFGSLSILCRPHVLIPRPETEEWVIKACRLLHTRNSRLLKVIDACTGTGCIALLTAAMLKCQVTAFDVSEYAVLLAKENARYNNRDETVILKRDIAENQAELGPVDVVFSNPPYIPYNDYFKPSKLDGVEQLVRTYEPELALIGNLEFFDHLVANVVLPCLAKAFVFELGYEEQAQHVARNPLLAGWTCGIAYDYAENPRCVVGWRDDRFSILQKLCRDIY